MFCRYEIEPISVKVTEEKRSSFLHFVVRLCGIIGGIFVSGKTVQCFFIFPYVLVGILHSIFLFTMKLVLPATVHHKYFSFPSPAATPGSASIPSYASSPVHDPSPSRKNSHKYYDLNPAPSPPYYSTEDILAKSSSGNHIIPTSMGGVVRDEAYNDAEGVGKRD